MAKNRLLHYAKWLMIILIALDIAMMAVIGYLDIAKENAAPFMVTLYGFFPHIGNFSSLFFDIAVLLVILHLMKK